MSTNINKGNQQLSFDYKAKAKGQEFNKLLYSIIKPGVYKGLKISPTGTNFISITSGYAFVNCLFQGETTRTTLARFSTQINSLQIPQTNSGEDEVVYLYFEYKELVENWVGIYHKPISSTLPVNSIILGTISYDGSGNIISVSYNNRQLGLFDEDYSLSDQNTFSNYLDNTKKSKLDLSNIPSGVTTSISLPSYDYGLSTIDDWQTARRYNEKEFVVYEGTIYRCVNTHTSSSFFADLSNWESLNNIQDKEIIRGFNNTASGLSQSRVVTISGDNITEQIPEVDYISSYSQEPLGIVIQDISSGTSGELQQRGRLVLTGIDLSSGVVGQKVYSDINGNLTMSITPLEVGQLLYPDSVNPIIYVAILPTEEGLNVINFNGQLSILENTIQKAFDRLDDYGYIPVWASGQTYRVSNVVVRPVDNFSLWACLTPHTSIDFNSDILNWIQITDNTAIKYTDVKDIITNNINLSVSGGIGATVQNVVLDLSNDPIFNSVSANSIITNEVNIGSSISINGSSGVLNDVDISEVSFINFYDTFQLTGISGTNPVNKIVILSNSSDNYMVVSNESALSVDQNRIITGMNSDISLAKDKNILLAYDSSINRWRVIAGVVPTGSCEIPITQTSHGLNINDYIIYDKLTSSWVKANSVGVYANGSIGYVVRVMSPDYFVIRVQGSIIYKEDLIAGEFYYVSGDGSGVLTVTPPNNQVQAVLFALENNLAVELSYPSVTPSQIVVTGSVTGSGSQILDEVLVDSILGVKWIVHSIYSSNVEMREIDAVHDGTIASDATDTDQVVFSKIRVGNVPGLTYTISLVGSGITQKMRLTATGTNAGTTHRFTRVPIVF